MRIIILFLFLPTLIYTQESIKYDFSKYTENTENEKNEKLSSKITTSLFFLGMAATTVGFNVWMREGVYKNNYSGNWWGTVNGALTLGLTGTVLGYGFSSFLFVISNGKFEEKNYLLCTIIGLTVGIVSAFLPPFYQAFRENKYLYYTFPALMSAGFISGAVDVWLRKERKSPLSVSINKTASDNNEYGIGLNFSFKL